MSTGPMVFSRTKKTPGLSYAKLGGQAARVDLFPWPLDLAEVDPTILESHRN